MSTTARRAPRRRRTARWIGPAVAYAVGAVAFGVLAREVRDRLADADARIDAIATAVGVAGP